MEAKYPVDFLGKEEQTTLRKLIDKGNELQEQLNENYIGGISFEYYVRKLNACIGKQDIIIEHIKGFRTDLQKWLKECKKTELLKHEKYSRKHKFII
jgi:flagellar biosynthesis chaperone FliJ